MSSELSDRETGVRILEWAGEDISMQQVLAQLNRMRAEFGVDEAAHKTHADARTSVMNLVAVADSRDAADRAGRVAERLAMHHPSRCIIICRDKESEELRIDAWIKSFDYEVISSTLVECECICLVVGRPTGEHLPSLIQPLMLSDVKTYLWWMGTPVWRSGSLSDALDACDGLVVDSAVFERPFDSFLELADLAVDRGGRESIADLHWTRLHQWREVLAQFFSPPDRRGFLKGINAVGIDYVGEARANRSAAALLAGWLASKLGWELKHAVGGKGGVVVAYMDSGHGHRVEIAFRSVPLAGLSEGEVSAVRFHAVSQGRTCAFSCERQPGAADHTSGGVTMKMQIGSEALTERLPMPVQGEVELLEHLLTGSGRDPVYLGALHEAASLLRAF